MRIEPGWYRTRDGDRACVGAVAPPDAVLGTETSYAIGWILGEDNWYAATWTENGRADEYEVHGDDLCQTELAAQTPPHEQN